MSFLDETKKPIPPELLSKQLFHFLNILSVLEPHDCIISKPDHKGFPLEIRLHFIRKPEVQHIVEIEVTEQW